MEIKEKSPRNLLFQDTRAQLMIISERMSQILKLSLKDFKESAIQEAELLSNDIIFQYVSTQTIHLLYRNYAQVTLFIISNKVDEISEMIHAITQHGATIIRGEGSYKNDERKMIYSVINESSEKAIFSNILAIDPKAFVNCVRTKEIQSNAKRLKIEKK